MLIKQRLNDFEKKKYLKNLMFKIFNPETTRDYIAVLLLLFITNYNDIIN